jgi:tetratricopeptide (TPR) repeat protein
MKTARRSESGAKPPVAGSPESAAGPGSVMPGRLAGLLRSRASLLATALCALVLWTFFPAVHGDFVGYDDPDYVTANARVRQGLTWSNVEWAFQSSDLGNWHPLTWLSHMLDCQVFGLEPWGHHLTSVVLHTLNALLAFLVLRQLTGADWRSVAVAALFALHPLRVESVAWIAERKDVLSTFFALLALWMYARYAGKPKIQNPQYKVFYGLALSFFLLGLMSKSMVVTLPFVLVLLDYWPLNRFQSENLRCLVLEKIPFLLATIAVSGITLAAQGRSAALMTGLPWQGRVENAAVSYCRYLGKLFAPADLAVFYPYAAHRSVAVVALAFSLLLFISLFAVASRRRYPWLPVGWLWFLGTLVPVIGLVQAGEQSMADRYSYIPSLGIFLIVVWGLDEATRRRPGGRMVLAALFAAAILPSIVLTRRQIAYWRDSEHLFRHAIKVTEKNYVAYSNLGTALDRQGRLDEAAREFREAILAKPGYAEAHKNLGLVLDEQRRFEEAISQFREALRINPDYAQAEDAWGTTLNQLGNLDEAIRHYREATRLRPDYTDAHYNLGLACARSGRVDDAIAEFQQAIRLNPDSADAYNNLGVAFGQKGQLDEAVRQYRRALQLKPDFARAHFNLGIALCKTGNLDEGIPEFKEALRLQPDYVEARKNLETALGVKQAAERPATAEKP